jgi:hypothetical protein
MNALEFVGDIGRYRHCLSSIILNLAGNSFSTVGVNIVDGDFGASGSQSFGDGFANTLPSPSDDSDFVIYSNVHFVLR